GKPVTPQEKAWRDSQHALYEFAKTIPPFNDGCVDAEGNLWVMRFALQDEVIGTYSTKAPLVYNVFDSTGRWLGDVTMPKRFRVMEIGNDYVLGINFDDDGVQYVHQYTLKK